MSALKKLLDFADQLPTNTGIEFLQLVQAYQKEMIADKMQLIEKYERIIRGTQNTPPYEVVAIAGTAETLLNEINVGDTVECIKYSCGYLDKNKKPILLNTILVVDLIVGNYGISFEGYSGFYDLSDFRKVQTPLTNPHQTVQGC